MRLDRLPKMGIIDVMKTFLTFVMAIMALGLANDALAYFRGGEYSVYLTGDNKAVNRSAYLQNKHNTTYRQMGNGRLVRENLLQEPSWYTVVPASHGTVDVFYVEAGQRKHMRARVDLWQRYGWDCRFNIGEQGAVQFGGKTWQ